MLKARSAKAKGSRLEKFLASTLRELGLDKHATRMPLSGAIPELREDVYTSLPIHIEAKNRETWQPLQWYKETKDKAQPLGKLPILALSRNHEEAYIFLAASDFFDIFKQAHLAGWTSGPRLAKPTKKRRASIEETKDFAFSKEKQLRRGSDEEKG